MNIYDIDRISQEIEALALESDGELSDEMYQKLVEAETQNIDQLTHLIEYIRSLELKISACDEEIKRIYAQKDHTDKCINGIKKYITPHIIKHRKMQVGTFTLSVRKSESVVIIDENKIPLNFMNKVEWFTPIKAAIKAEIKAGKNVPGAELKENQNLQIK
jgi:hypothetical protein